VALELRRTSGEDAGDLLEQCVRYLGMAGDRAADLDVDRSVALYERAIDLLPETHADRDWLTARWGSALLSQRARNKQAMAVLEAAAVSLEAAGDLERAARSWLWLAEAQRALVRDAASSAEHAVELLESLPPGQALVDAYAGVAIAYYVLDMNAEAATWGQRSLDAAATLGLAESVHALGALGGARSSLGDPGGLDDMHRAIRLGIERGEGSTTAGVYNNLALEVWMHVGAPQAVGIQREGIRFAQARGVRNQELNARATMLEFLLGMGAFDEALTETEVLLRDPSITEDPVSRDLVRLAHLRTRSIRGETIEIDELRTFTALSDQPQALVEWCASIAPALASLGWQDDARSTLREVADSDAARTAWNYPTWLPQLMRTAVAVEALDLGRSLLHGVENVTPTKERGLVAARAVLLEAEGETESAADHYLDAATRYEAGGWVLEEAYARLGAGRCLSRLGDPRSGEELARARTFFTSVGARPLITEIDALTDDVVGGVGG
jgi:tetratricopeptide (TPR) repeat protein